MGPHLRGRLLSTLAVAAGCTGTIAPETPAPPAPSAPGAPADRPDDGSLGPAAAPAPCTASDVGFTALRPLGAHEYATAMRELFSGVDPALLPQAAAPGSLDLSAATLEQVDRDARALLAGVIGGAKAPSWLGCTFAAGVEACRDRLIGELGQRIFRRPLAADERRELQAMFDGLRAEGFSAEQSGSVVARAMLQSPEFLYHLELPATAAPVYELSDHAFAARLSYFLWQSMPDAGLLRAAGAGELRTEAGLAAEVRRMLADPRAAASLEDGVERWLGIDDLARVEKSRAAYPQFDARLRDEMRAETRALLRVVMRDEGGRLPALLEADYTIAGPPLAALYGVRLTGSGPQRVALPAAQRKGVLTHASVLSAHGASDGSHPVKRGILVRTHLLCQDVPPPPPEVDVSIDPARFTGGASTRAVFTAHLTTPTCASCHRLMDPLGFLFEHYDGIGRWRATDGGSPVDARGELRGTDVDGPLVGAIELASRAARSAEVASCFARRLYERLHARLADRGDRCAVEELGRWFAGSDRNITELIMKLTAHPSSRHRRREPSP